MATETQKFPKVSKTQIDFLRNIMKANGSEKEASYTGSDVSFRWRAVNGRLTLSEKRINEYKEECPYFIGLELPQPTIEEVTAEAAAEVAEKQPKKSKTKTAEIAE